MFGKKCLGLLIFFSLSATPSLPNSSQFTIADMPCWSSGGCSSACIKAMADGICKAFREAKTSSLTAKFAVTSNYCKTAGDFYAKQHKSTASADIFKSTWVGQCSRLAARIDIVGDFLNGLAAALYTDANGIASVDSNIKFSKVLSVLGCICPYKADLGNLQDDPKLNSRCTIISKNLDKYMGITVSTKYSASGSANNSLESVINYYSSSTLGCKDSVSSEYTPYNKIIPLSKIIKADTFSNDASSNISSTSLSIPSMDSVSISKTAISKPVI